MVNIDLANLNSYLLPSLKGDGHIVITGATGWVGRTALHELQKIIPPSEFLNRVICFASKKSQINSTAYPGLEPLSIPIYPLSDLPDLAKSRSILAIFHSAFLTRDRLVDLGHTNYVAMNRWITNQVISALKVSINTRIIIISSGAASIYNSGGDIENMISNDPYGVLKREEEVRLNNLASESLILRIYALSGRFIRKPERFALGDFLTNALSREVIKLKSQNHVFRSYGNASDISAFGWRWLLHESPPKSNGPIAAVNFEIDLLSLAKHISTFYCLPEVKSSIDDSLEPSMYIADSKPFIRYMLQMGLIPMNLNEQIYDTAKGLSNLKS